MQINPAVSAVAEMFTDGRITDQVLADVAAMHCLPLYIDTPARGIGDLTDMLVAARRDFTHAVVMQGWALKRCNKWRNGLRRGIYGAALGMSDARAELARANSRRATAARLLRSLDAEMAAALAALPAPLALAA